MALFIITKKYTEKGEIMADCNREHEYRLDKLDERMDKLSDWSNGMNIKIEKVDESSKSAHSRIDELRDKVNDVEKMSQAVLEISFSVKNIAEELKEVVNSFKDHQKDISNKLDEQDTKIEELNNKPAKALMSAFLYVLGGITTIFIGYALAKWGIK